LEGNSEADPLAGGIAEATHLRVTVRLANSWGSFVDVSPSTDAWGNSFGCPQADVGGSHNSTLVCDGSGATYLSLSPYLPSGWERGTGQCRELRGTTLPSTHTSLLQRLESFVLEWVAHQNCAEAGNCRYSLEGQSLLDQSFAACSALSSVLSVGIPRSKQWTPVFGVWFKGKHHGVLGPHV